MLGPMSRLWQTVRPIRFRLYLGLLSAMTASIVALMIPQVLEFIVNRLETDAVAATIWTGGAVVLGLGFLEASLIWMRDRKSTRLNSSHVAISYAVFCLKKKKKW